LWTPGIRNVIFKLIEFEGRSNALGYYLSPASLKVVRDVLGSKIDTSNDVAASCQKFDKGMAEALLQKLVEEESTSFMVMDAEKDPRPRAGFKISRSDTVAEESVETVNNYVIRFINPQINLDSASSEHEKAGVLLLAERMDLKCFSYIDNRNDELVKYKRIVNIEDTQILTHSAKNVHTFIPDHRLQEILELEKWPLWIAIENIIDRNFNRLIFEEVVHQATINIYSKIQNPLYVHPECSKEAIRSTLEEHQKSDVLKFSSPKIVLSANSNQFNLIYHVAVDLLIYKEPARKERMERLKSLLLAIELYDIRDAINTVLALQNTIKILEIRRKTQLLGGREQHDGDINETNLKLQTAKDDLLFMMEALTVYGEKKKKSESLKTVKTILASNEVIWTLLLDDSKPLCLFNLKNSIFTQTINRDQSIVNVLEIDHILVKNVRNPLLFPELIAPYCPDKKEVDFRRNKMLRVYWSEVPPVGGIPIVDHFELNIFPLSFQIEYETGKQLIYYVFPAKRTSSTTPIPVKTPEGDTEHQPTNDLDHDDENSEQRSHRDSPLVFVEANADFQTMKDRASEYRTYIYIKIPGVIHCFSYKVSVVGFAQPC
jgi:hypothetical protein